MTRRWQYTSFLITFGLLLSLLVVLDYCSTFSPSMVVEPLVVDFGDVSTVNDVRRVITVKNTGWWSPLVIERVLMNCSSCITVHSYPKEPIPPGKQGNIDFTLNISTNQGKIEMPFIIISNAEPQKVVVVEVTANVLPEDKVDAQDHESRKRNVTERLD